MTYIGRFAPSPSGPLHLGSLVAAIASYLDAKSNQGLWLLRIEDIDPPRQIKDADKIIQQQLNSFGLNWDGEILYQSTRLEAYQQQLNDWLRQDKAYCCNCTRQQIKANGGVHAATCKQLNLSSQGNAIRYNNPKNIEHFSDLIHGQVKVDSKQAFDDFVLFRRDGLYAYQLAVVLDDIFQKVSHVVRGQDLLETSVWQIALYNSLNQATVQYAHLPLVLAQDGRKLSKQNGAPSVSEHDIAQQITQVLNILGQKPPLELNLESKETILTWAIDNWRPQQIPKSSIFSQ
ncbi:tRNA glutamyl-Q(34) synthetase GluQRS [Catenovulum maritimum]|uniref:Glutamyl-Q tRNA(Asp) synthetase n=1 Tax=Catenovulum maritimum TaxID=1513271 RepID=A0A0J8JNP3_9ALTE|nr:tRNA glutamyl-Q(34) synthetase GluQRS [Catenovulum maritimum]KMT66241.1 glutamyl-tRNA synthetase [Catenovulum maritimum]